jgi:hypothetical protein
MVKFLRLLPVHLHVPEREPKDFRNSLFFPSTNETHERSKRVKQNMPVANKYRRLDSLNKCLEVESW